MNKYLLFYFALFFSCLANAASITSTATGGTYSLTTTWSGGVVPGAGDDVTIAAGATVTVTDARTCLSLTMNGASAYTTLQINSGITLTVTGALTVNPPTGGNNDNTIAVGDGILVCGSFTTVNSGNNNRRCLLTINTGTLTCSGNFTIGNNTTRNLVTFTSSGLLQLGGGTNTMANGQFTPSTGTIEYNMAGAQSVLTLSYYSLKCSGSGIKTLAAATILTGNLSIAGTAQLDVSGSNYALNVAGNWNVTSTNALPFNAEAGTVTLNGSATQNVTTVLAGGEVFYNLTISNTSGSNPGVQINQNQSLAGSTTLNFTQTTTLTVTGNLSMASTSTITGSATGLLNVSGTFSDIAAGTESIGRVTLNVTGASTINGTLTLSSATGTKSLNGGLTLANGSNITFGASATLAVGTSLTCNGTNSITYSTAGTFSTTAATINGTTTFDGTATGVTNFASSLGIAAAANLNLGQTAVTATGASTITGSLTITSATGAKNLSGGATIANGGKIIFSAAATLTIGTSLTCNGANTITYNAAGTLSSAAATINGSTTIDGTVTGTTNFTSTISVPSGGTLTIGNTALTASSTLTLGGNTVFTNATGNKTFNNITINAGGIWNNAPSVDQTYNISAGNLTNNGTFTYGATNATVYNFTSVSQVNGTLAIPTFSVQSGTTTNNATLTISNQLSGAGSFTQGTTGYLYYTSSSNITVTTFVASAASNTVDYNYAGAQNIKNVTYYNLTASNLGTKKLLGATTVGANLSVTGTAQLDVDVTNNYALSVAGNWSVTSTNASPFLAEAGTVTFNGTSGTQSLTTTSSQESFYSLTINNTSGSATGVSVDKNMTVNNVFTLTSGTLSIGTNSLICLGNAAVNAGGVSGTGIIVCTGTVVTFGTTAGGPTVVPTVSVSTSSITMQRGTFSNAVTITKISSSSVSDAWRGGNTFNGIFTLTNAAVGDTVDPHGDIYLGNATGDPVDIFNANSYFYVKGSSRLRIPYQGAATFNAPAHFYAMGIGPSGSSSKTGYDRIQIARSSTGTATFNDSCILYCTSTTTDIYVAFSAGNSATFNGPVVATHSGTSAANFFLGGDGSVALNNDLYLNNTGTGTINMTDLTGIATMASGKALKVGSMGFSSGTLYLKNFVQLGSTPQTLNFTGTAVLKVGLSGAPCTFNGPVSFSSPNINLAYSNFKGTANSFTMSGSANQSTTGGNSFGTGSSNTFVNTGTGYWRLANTAADTIYGDATFKRTSTGTLNPAYATACYYYGNISVAAGSDTVDCGNGGGTIILSGTSSGSFTNNGTKGISMKNITMNKTGGASFTLNNCVGMPANGSLTLTSGLLNTSTSAYLYLMDETCTAPALTDASTSYINGPMRYDMSVNAVTKNLNFPIGAGADCRPFVLTTRHGSATSYSYLGQVYNSPASMLVNGSGNSWGLPATVDTVSGVHYWTIDRTVTSTSVSASNTNLTYLANTYPLVQFYFGTNDYVYQGANLTIVKNTSAAPTTWIDIGASCALGNFATPQAGSITSTTSGTPFNSFSTFALGSKTSGWNSLPIELLSFTAKPNGEQVDLNWETSTETNNKFFTIERSADGKNFAEITTANSKAINGNSKTALSYQTTDASPLSGTSYYRLKQTDYNGKYKYFNMVSVAFEASKNITFSVYPNPNLGEFTVDFSGIENNHEVQIALCDELGKEVYSNSVYSNSIHSNQVQIIPASKIAKGKYFCSLIFEGIKRTLVVIVN